MVSVGLAWAFMQEPQAQHGLKKARSNPSSTTDLTLQDVGLEFGTSR